MLSICSSIRFYILKLRIIDNFKLFQTLIQNNLLLFICFKFFSNFFSVDSICVYLAF
uniref:Uncharacterized protein n=1 Tax=Physcomitrium patens TaxID=3218 RepID=A0A2K1KKB9_PHYPA|nr:hypothetical protein PHYPA_007905 [Physcomitrium patens]